MPMSHPGLAVTGPWTDRVRSHAPSMAFTCLAAMMLVLGAVAGTAPVASTLTIAALVPAAIVDLHERRLPDVWVGAAAAVFVAAVAVTSVVATDEPITASLAAGIAGAVAMGVPLLVLHLASPAAMGYGDVKAAAVLGAACGIVHWHLALSALALAAGGAAVTGLVGRRRTVPFGPFLVLAAATALATANVWLDASIGVAS